MNAGAAIQEDTEFLAKKYLLMKLVEQGHSVDAEILKGSMVFSKYQPKRLGVNYTIQELEHFEELGIIEKDRKYKNITAYKAGPKRDEHWKQEEMNSIWCEFLPKFRDELNAATKMIEIYTGTVRNEFYRNIKDSYGSVIDLPLLSHRKHTNYREKIITINPLNTFGVEYIDFWRMHDDTRMELIYQHIVNNLSAACTQNLIEKGAKSRREQYLKKVSESKNIHELEDIGTELCAFDQWSLVRTFNVIDKEMEKLWNCAVDIEGINRRIEKSINPNERKELLLSQLTRKENQSATMRKMPDWMHEYLKSKKMSVNEYLKRFYAPLINEDNGLINDANENMSGLRSVMTELKGDFIASQKEHLIDYIHQHANEDAARKSRKLERDYVKNIFERKYVKLESAADEVEILPGANYIEGLVEFLKKNGIEFMSIMDSQLEWEIQKKYPEFNSLKAPEGCAFNIPAGRCKTVLKRSHGGYYFAQCDHGLDGASAKVFFPEDESGVYFSPKDGEDVAFPIKDFTALLDIFKDFVETSQERPEKQNKVPEHVIHLTADSAELKEIRFTGLEKGTDYFIPRNEVIGFAAFYKALIGEEEIEKLKEDIMPPAEEA